IAQASNIDCWLVKRMLRAGVCYGVVASLPLYPEQPGLVVIELQQSAPECALDSVLAVLAAWLRCAQAEARPVELLASDPHPALWVDGRAHLLEVNKTAAALFGPHIGE